MLVVLARVCSVQAEPSSGSWMYFMYLFLVLAFALTLIITSFTSYSYIFLVTKKIHFFNYLRFSSSKIQLKIMSKFRHCLQEVYNRDDWGNLGAATEKAVDPLNTLKKVVIENTPILWSI